jgi:hypothetical protein
LHPSIPRQGHLTTHTNNSSRKSANCALTCKQLPQF